MVKAMERLALFLAVAVALSACHHSAPQSARTVHLSVAQAAQAMHDDTYFSRYGNSRVILSAAAFDQKARNTSGPVRVYGAGNSFVLCNQLASTRPLSSRAITLIATGPRRDGDTVRYADCRTGV